MPVSFNNHLAGQIYCTRYRRKGGGGRPFSGAVVLRLSSCLEVRHNLELLGCNLGLCCSAGYLHSSLNPEASRSELWPRPSSGFVEGLRATVWFSLVLRSGTSPRALRHNAPTATYRCSLCVAPLADTQHWPKQHLHTTCTAHPCTPRLFLQHRGTVGSQKNRECAYPGPVM
jgi:hypothetical protein